MLNKIFDELAFRRRARELNSRPISYYADKAKSIPRVESNGQVVVTLTTIPERISHLGAMLSSLLDQSARPDQINLCIPNTSRLPPFRYQIPDWFKNVPLLKIIRANEDFGPITKLIPTLLTKPAEDTKIIIVDDDGLYPKTLIEALVGWSNQLPDAALGCSGVVVPQGMTPSEILFSDLKWKQNLRITPKSSHALSKVSYLFGYAGFLVKPQFFTDRLMNYAEAPGGAFFDDDLWIGGNLHRQGVERYVIPSHATKLMPAASRQTLHTRALCLTDNSDGKNMDEVYRHLFV